MLRQKLFEEIKRCINCGRKSRRHNRNKCFYCGGRLIKKTVETQRKRGKRNSNTFSLS